MEHAGRPLSSYEVDYDPKGGRGEAGRLLRVEKPTLFETPFAPSQMRLFGPTEKQIARSYCSRCLMSLCRTTSPRSSSSM